MLKTKQRLNNYTTTELANLYRIRKKEVDDFFEILDLGAEYLETRNKKNVWSTLDGTEHSLRKLAKSLNDQSSTADKEVLKSLAFVFIDDPDAAGERLYNFIPKIGTHLQAVKSNLESQLPT